MRTLVIGLCACAIALPVAAQTNQPRDPNRVAYGYTLRCFATAAGVISDPRSTANEVAAARERSRRTFDAGVRLGHALGLSGQRVSEDFDATARAEAVLLVRDVAYFRQSQAECARLGM